MNRTPPALDAVTLRDLRASDEAALFQLYTAVRSEELGMESWASEVREQILRIQFAAQFRAYREEFPHADERLILLDGVPIGWVIVDRSGDKLHGIDIAVLAEARRQAIGLRVIRALQGEAAAGQRPMLITVLRQNVRALALYDRLGFHAIRATEVHIVMEWRGDPQQP